MVPAGDPALMRVGMELPADASQSAARVAELLNELLARGLNLGRLMIVIGPILLQSLWIHEVEFGSWLFRLLTIYGVVGGLSILLVPRQAYSGMALKELAWMFAWLYPDEEDWVSKDKPDEAALSLLQGLSDMKGLSGTLVQLRLHGTAKCLCVTSKGWVTTGDRSLATVLQLQPVFAKGDRVPDTYTLKVSDTNSDLDQAWLSFQPVNQLRFGGWLQAVSQSQRACPYKVIRDSSCPPGACKLLSAWTEVPPVGQHYCTGFYLAEQLYFGRPYIGHGPDRDAAILELVVV